MTDKEHALKISEMWSRIAESETPLGFWFRPAEDYSWLLSEGAPDSSSVLSNWKVGPVFGKPISRANAAHFASLWLRVSEGASFERWDANGFSWEKVRSVPSPYDPASHWRAMKNSPKPSVAYVWKRTDTGEFTDDPIEAAYWEKRNYPILRFALVEQA